jgi:hypothetical protein
LIGQSQIRRVDETSSAAGVRDDRPITKSAVTVMAINGRLIENVEKRLSR